MRERSQNRRERSRIASQSAVEEFRLHFDWYRADRRFEKLPPLAAYVAFHMDLLEAAEKAPLTKEHLNTIGERHEAFDEVWFSERPQGQDAKR